jgi:hypothetical protein
MYPATVHWCSNLKFEVNLTVITVDNNEHETSTTKGFKQKTLLQFKWNVINSF